MAEMAEMNSKMQAILERMTVAPPEKPKRTMSEAHKAALKAGREAAKRKQIEAT